MTHPANEQPKLDLEALKEVAEAATPGPWELVGSSVTNWHDHTFEMEWIANGSGEGVNENEAADGQFIATFDPPTVLALIARVQEGEEKACETCNDRGEIGGWFGQTAESGGYETEPCPDCASTPKAGDEGAVAWMRRPIGSDRTWTLFFDEDNEVEFYRSTGRYDVRPLFASPFSGISRDVLIDVIMRETTDEIIADGWDSLGKPNVLVQGCKFIRGHQRGYANPEQAARNFAGLIADAILTLTAGASNAEGGDKANIDDAVHYVVRFGGQCRDCGDHDGVCPSSGLPCENAAKTVRHVIDALRYGVKFGFIASPLPNAEGDAR